jgi:TPR repeat protein
MGSKAMRLGFALLLAGASVPHDAQPQAADPWAPAAFFSRSDALPPSERPDPDRWPDRDDLPSWLDDRDLDRWTAQARAGRAQAAINAGDHLMLRVGSARGNCADAIDWYRQAEELGSDQAAARLGGAYADDNCPQRDLTTAIEWWRQAVELGAVNAARVLTSRLSERGSRQHDPVLALAYAELAADEPAPSPASSAPPADFVELAAGMTPAQIEEARRIADASRAAIRARTQRFSVEPPQESLLRRETAEATVRISALDDLRECERNLIGNCRGVRRLAYADVSNLTDEYLRC